MTNQTTGRSVLLLVLVLFAGWGIWGAAVSRQAVQADGAAPDQVQVTPAPIRNTAGEKLIALTFDDGPRRATTTRLLDGLAERGVQATFFLIGAQVEGNEDVVRRMDREGHQIGIHTYDHVTLAKLNRADFNAQVDSTRSILKSTLGHNDFLLRPPYGMLDNSVKEWAGCPIILWSIDPEDWKDRNADRVVEHVVQKAENGGIILLHDIFPESVDAALRIVDQLHAKGYLFCTIDDIFAVHAIELKEGESYWNAYP